MNLNDIEYDNHDPNDPDLQISDLSETNSLLSEHYHEHDQNQFNTDLSISASFSNPLRGRDPINTFSDDDLVPINPVHLNPQHSTDPLLNNESTINLIHLALSPELTSTSPTIIPHQNPPSVSTSNFPSTNDTNSTLDPAYQTATFLVQNPEFIEHLHPTLMTKTVQNCGIQILGTTYFENINLENLTFMFASRNKYEIAKKFIPTPGTVYRIFNYKRKGVKDGIEWNIGSSTRKVILESGIVCTVFRKNTNNTLERRRYTLGDTVIVQYLTPNKKLKINS